MKYLNCLTELNLLNSTILKKSYMTTNKAYYKKYDFYILLMF